MLILVLIMMAWHLVINTLFSTIFGRRLGTESDGTSLRGSPQVGVDPDFDDSYN